VIVHQVGHLPRDVPGCTSAKHKIQCVYMFHIAYSKDITSLYRPAQFGFYSSDSLISALLELFLNAFAKLRKATVSFVTSVTMKQVCSH